ncbi:hypothetical protein [Laspinema olomoucense]|uniref:Uncharacterized protein n=1 Tax=Laspinema olomoucense D3b TaxID=2953688 RepID=A0ABT2N4B1_9CYAN|nr:MULTISPECIES: hypothetical protein [unclassified Laspinema]MCT7973601.1 hypothetical protein [Laspinema sp. D3d]MCT7977529.1 hypothetical protein [Laspinema sp. D3b]
MFSKAPSGTGGRSRRLSPIRLRGSILEAPWLPLEAGGKQEVEPEGPDGVQRTHVPPHQSTTPNPDSEVKDPTRTVGIRCQI